jgi:hypothetical protein
MNQHDNFDDFLTQQLREQQPYLPDDGFSAGVMAQLTNERRLSRRTERLIIGIPLLSISLLVFSQLPMAEAATLMSRWLVALEPVALLKLGALFSFGILLGCGGWFARQLRLL